MAVFSLDEHTPELPGAEEHWIAESATVVGRVTLGRDVGIWFGAVLRGDGETITVGARSNVQDNAVLHADPGFPLLIGTGCTIGHGAVVHGCTLGDNVLIGMGAIVMNGARIGANSIVGAGALVTEGKVFPADRLIVGAPARAVRKLGPEDAARIAAGADVYVERQRRYARGAARIAGR